MEENEKSFTNDSQPDSTPQAETDGASAAGGRQWPKAERSARKDRNRLHATHHGILSRHPLQALVRSGENSRELRRIKHLLRAELRPKGMLGDLIFDRAWSSYLRCILIARTETDVLAPEDHASSPADRLPILREAQLPTLVYDGEEVLNRFSAELLTYLAIVQRYDAHFCKEFYRAVGMLLAMRDAGEAGLTQLLARP